jgi:hypothetical protein
MFTTLLSSLRNLTQDGEMKLAFGPMIDGIVLKWAPNHLHMPIFLALASSLDKHIVFHSTLRQNWVTWSLFWLTMALVVLHGYHKFVKASIMAKQ